MPPRVMSASQAGSGFQAWWEGLAPITKYLAITMIGVTVAGNMGIINPAWIALFWPKVFKKFEIWRLLTNHLFIGRLGFNFLIRMIWLLQYGSPLELITYQFEPASYMFMIIFNALLLDVAAPFVGFAVLGTPLIASIIYVWARNFPDQDVSLYGLVKVKAFYMPFAFACITLLLGQSLVTDLLGIGVGHIYYFLHDVYPLKTGKQILVTPRFLVNWLADAGLRGAAPTPAPGATQGAPSGFQAFRGSGRRLGSS